ncbi:Sarcosine oxidase gamma subunit [Pseudonocardia sp. Ae168_Ps1]|uniref:sarcosine oxidase subunit gamma n=1 Tax=unclassified Pseudonocardia TaxID=2619320 RepID=UPI00094B42AB|nr:MULTISPECIES: sarcosine oxidase subunit gamma family protein [unclassified Pseudonocardia]OLL76117.1 Sarcosine oxidase gamma subunit [Pseudonocardia sp. Ae150A_Ps1]OLL82115.1 Sarcosine oxidase gamma subunit [Pseudonocardia sp. Ae168_Ps1]OLL83771.1 Sarcosine oxidase gamma subunit [Pseudonocardia sp. Ae263_Ps1]OLL90189.1 Sarcosine oxidase gamma subunit [Pseudonocardia sp. Ae356_Ps1]
MAETRPLEPARPLEAWEPEFTALARETGGDLTIEIEDVGLATNLRLDPESRTRAVASALLGAEIPTRPNTWVSTSDGEIVWLGPDEWLVTSRHARPHAGEESLRSVVAEHGGSAVDVSGQRVVLRLRGRLARELLALGCALDLHPSEFPAGRCAQTVVAQTGVILVALGHADDYLLHVRPSFAGHLADRLLDAATESRVAPAR